MFDCVLNTPLVINMYLSSISVVENHSETLRKFLVLKFCGSSFILEKFFFRLTEMHSWWRFKSKTEALIKRNSFSLSRYPSISMRNSDFWCKFSEKKKDVSQSFFSNWMLNFVTFQKKTRKFQIQIHCLNSRIIGWYLSEVFSKVNVLEVSKDS